MLFILLNFYIFTLYPQQELRIYYLDVGQGDGILIRYPTGENLLIDTGKDSQIFRSLDLVLPWYEKTIDAVLLTHGDLDHVGALVDLLDRYTIRHIFVSEFFGQADVERHIQEKAQSKNVSITVLHANDILTVGTKITNNFKISNPQSDCLIIFKNENDCSLVGTLIYGEKSFLFTGDISQKVEDLLKDKVQSPVTILKVAHHGSNGSSSEIFLNTIKPVYSIISSGKDNPYHHPRPETIQRLQTVGTMIFDTQKDATIVASSGGIDIKVKKLFDETSFFQSSVCAILLYSFDSSC